MKIQIKNQDAIAKELIEQFKYSHPLAAPKMLKIVVNMGVNEAVENKGMIVKAGEQLGLITGQKPAVAKAKKSISAFKLRKGVPLGVKVTLRGKRMFSFWEKIVKIVLPRQRDFKGISERGFDGRGNLNFGFREQVIFPDIEYDKVDKLRGLEITVVTSAKTNEEAKALLEKMGMPFRKF